MGGMKIKDKLFDFFSNNFFLIFNQYINIIKSNISILDKINKGERDMKVPVMLFIIIFTTCASTSSREGHILDFTEEKKTSYGEYLAVENQYTTGGVEYHKKYNSYLIGIAAVAIEEKKLNIVKQSIGFYYDKKKNVKNELYLGLDVNIGEDYPYQSYNEAAVTRLKKYLRDLLYIINSCRTVFAENEIAGMVVGFKWTRGSLNESVNIWIDKKDVLLFEDGKLTFDELICRNTITDTEGKIIRLPI
jgi:hypothetical protein